MPEKTPQPIDLTQALRDPASVFSDPEAVLGAKALSDAQKIEVLRRWLYDAAEMAVATEEGMPGAETDLSRRILLALEHLGTDLDSEHTGPSKQHGLLRSSPKPE